MTECRRIESLLPPYVDGDAPPGAVAQIDAHLASCADCRHGVAAGRTARAVLRARAAELRSAAPPGLRTRIVASLGSEEQPALGWLGRLGAFTAAAAAIVVLLTALEFVPASSNVLFAAQLAIDHVRCFVVHLGTIDEAHTGDVQREFRERYGWTIDAPARNEELGLSLVAARRCPFWLGSHAHLLYRSGAHNVSLYVTPGETRPAETLGVLGHVERIWTANGQVYALVSRGVPAADFDRIATFLEHETTPR